MAVHDVRSLRFSRKLHVWQFMLQQICICIMDFLMII